MTETYITSYKRCKNVQSSLYCNCTLNKYSLEEFNLLEHGYIQIYTGDGKGKTTAA